jgi:hypothetical protein
MYVCFGTCGSLDVGSSTVAEDFDIASEGADTVLVPDGTDPEADLPKLYP